MHVGESNLNTFMDTQKKRKSKSSYMNKIRLVSIRNSGIEDANFLAAHTVQFQEGKIPAR